MQRKCVYCGRSFTPSEESPKALCCSINCVRKRLKERQKNKVNGTTTKKHRSMTINEVLRWAEQHYKETGEMLWYGHAVARIEGAGQFTLERHTKV